MGKFPRARTHEIRLIVTSITRTRAVRTSQHILGGGFGRKVRSRSLAWDTGVRLGLVETERGILATGPWPLPARRPDRSGAKRRAQATVTPVHPRETASATAGEAVG